MNSRLETIGRVSKEDRLSHRCRVSHPFLVDSKPDLRGCKAAFLLVVVFTLAIAAHTHAATCDQAITDKMMVMYGLDTGSYKIEILSNRLKSAMVGADDIVIRPLTTKEPLGLFTVMVKVLQGGEIIESGQVRMKIRQFADVLVLSDRVGSREKLSEDQLTIRRIDITSLHEKPLRSVEAIDGYRTKRNLRRGTILTTAAIEPIPDIEAGRELSIVYIDGFCRITTAGVALQSGMAGDYVKVKNKGSGKIILARIVDGTAVTVDP
jgi:flagella basal body P-ring formation protein FlgA